MCKTFVIKSLSSDVLVLNNYGTIMNAKPVHFFRLEKMCFFNV